MSSPSTIGQYPDIPTLAQTLLGAIGAQYQAAGVALPDRQYIAAGAPNQIAWDCEQLVISLQGIGWGVAEEAFQQTVQTGTGASVQGPRHAVLVVQLVRCLPTPEDDGTPPSADDLTDAGLTYLKDCALLSQAMQIAAAELARPENLGRGAVTRFGIVDPEGPAGGFVGASASLYVSLTKLNGQ